MGDDKDKSAPPDERWQGAIPPFRPDPNLIAYLEGGRPGQRRSWWPWRRRRQSRSRERP